MMSKLSGHLARVLVGLAMLGGILAGPALAHPHVWITVRATLLHDKGAFTGIAHTWIFDEYYTAMAIEGLDKNNDGKYDREELAELAKVNMDGLKEFGYFTGVSAAGQEVKFSDPSDYWLEYTGSVLSLHFVLPFAQPVPVETKGLTMSVQDPTFFIAFDLAKTDAAKLGPGAPAACKIRVGAPGGDDNGNALGNAIAKQFGAGVVAGPQAIFVDCQGP
jgi:ABC-type uncharacterized transport system substrate-binding protein